MSTFIQFLDKIENMVYNSGIDYNYIPSNKNYKLNYFIFFPAKEKITVTYEALEQLKHDNITLALKMLKGCNIVSFFLDDETFTCKIMKLNKNEEIVFSLSQFKFSSHLKTWKKNVLNKINFE